MITVGEGNGYTSDDSYHQGEESDGYTSDYIVGIVTTGSRYH